MNKLLYYIFVFAFPINLFAQSEWIPAGGRSAAMGSTSVTYTDFWSIHNNQAGLAFFDKTASGIYFENRYLIKELGYQSGAFALQTKYGMLGATMGYSGDANYNTTKVGVVYARKFGNRVAAGVQLDYIGTSLSENYGDKSIITFEAGILVKLTEQLTFGAHTFNPIHANLVKNESEWIPATLNAGLGYTISDKIILTAEAFKNSNHPLEFRTGAEYKLNHMMYTRLGLSTNPFKYTFGFGIELKQFSFDLASSVHPQLGYSPQVSLNYIFGK